MRRDLLADAVIQLMELNPLVLSRDRYFKLREQGSLPDPLPGWIVVR